MLRKINRIKILLKLIFNPNSTMSLLDNVEAKIASLGTSLDALETRISDSQAASAANELTEDDANRLIASVQVLQDRVDGILPAPIAPAVEDAPAPTEDAPQA